MKKVHNLLKSSILGFIDFFYPVFRKFMPLQTFRYAACGGGNMVLDILLYAICYNFILHKQNLHLSLLTVSPHIASFILAFCITFPTGFYLSRYVVFKESELKRRTQLTRYILVVLCCILLNYIFIKILVEYFGWYPTPSKVITTVLVTCFSYLSQTYYSFNQTQGKKIK